MKNFIQNELVCIRALEPIGSDRYEELSKAIQWLDENTLKKEENKQEVNAPKYAHTTIRWKDDVEHEEEAIIAIGCPYIEKYDEQILFYCENKEEFENLKHYENGEDFFVDGCTIFTDTLD